MDDLNFNILIDIRWRIHIFINIMSEFICLTSISTVIVLPNLHFSFLIIISVFFRYKFIENFHVNFQELNFFQQLIIFYIIAAF